MRRNKRRRRKQTKLFAAGDETSPAAKSEEKRMFLQANLRSGSGECRSAFENGLPSVAPQQRQEKVSMLKYFKMHVIL